MSKNKVSVPDVIAEDAPELDITVTTTPTGLQVEFGRSWTPEQKAEAIAWWPSIAAEVLNLDTRLVRTTACPSWCVGHWAQDGADVTRDRHDSKAYRLVNDDVTVSLTADHRDPSYGVVRIRSARQGTRLEVPAHHALVLAALVEGLAELGTGVPS